MILFEDRLVQDADVFIGILEAIKGYFKPVEHLAKLHLGRGWHGSIGSGMEAVEQNPFLNGPVYAKFCEQFFYAGQFFGPKFRRIFR